MYVVAKVVKATKPLPNGSVENTIAASAPDGSLQPIANLKDFKIALESLSNDEKTDMNYAVFNVINKKVFYVPDTDLNNVVNTMDNFTGSIRDLQVLNYIKKTFPIIKATSFGKDHSFVIF